MPGIANSATCILKNLAKALFLAPTPFPDLEFAEEAEHILGAALATSDAIAARAGLTRWMATPESLGTVHVPSDGRLVALKAAVRWPKAFLPQELRRRHIRVVALQRITAATRDVTPDDWDLERPLLFRRPILSLQDQYIVALPGALLSAAINAVLDLAVESNVHGQLAARYNSAVWDSVKRALGLFDLPSPAPVPLPNQIACLRDGIVPFDTDKAMHVLVVTDPLDDYRPWKERTPPSSWCPYVFPFLLKPDIAASPRTFRGRL